MSEDETDTKKTTDDSQVVDKLVEPRNSALYEKSQSLVDIANNTFKELCLTLENEQTKLLELEERRKKLQEEMQRLKMEIEEEKKSYNLNVMDACAENLEILSAASSTSVDNSEQIDEQTESVKDFVDQEQTDICSDSVQSHQLDTCFEVDESNEDEEVADDDSQNILLQVDSAAKKIHRQLQSVAAECIIEQCKIVDVTGLTGETSSSKQHS